MEKRKWKIGTEGLATEVQRLREGEESYLFVAKGDDGVHAEGAAGWDVAG
jgi:hypothetical protein